MSTGVNTSALRNEVSNKAKQTSNNLEGAYEYLSGITIPSDFSSSGRAKVTKAKSSLKDQSTFMTNFKKEINKKADIFDKMESTNESLINKLVSSQVANNEAQLQAQQIQAEATAQAVGTVVASLTNLVIGLVEGIAIAGEGLVDTLATVGAVLTTAATFIIDLNTGITTGNWSFDETSDLWKETMSYVATDHVGNAFSSFYEKNKVGQWLDANATTGFTSDGFATRGCESYRTSSGQRHHSGLYGWFGYRRDRN